MYYSKEIVDEVRDRNDIVDVISSYVGLKKSGANYMCCCPFHSEKSPSFSVSREKHIFHCFGCGAGGDVITFVRMYENVPFPEAVKQLADRVGMDLPEQELSEEDKKKYSRREKLYEINREAAVYFHLLLTRSERGKKGYQYFRDRGLTDETIKNFGLGYADIYRDDLYKYLKSKGYSNELMRDAGLVKFDEKYGPSDMFWNRVIVPITDINNRVVAFGGRVLGDAKPKYLNTKETEIFIKNRNLFAMYTAKSSRRKGIILCEGYMDVIAMHQAGFTNATASLGTAFTEGQANVVKKYTSDVYLAYDSDEAGTKAAMKAISILRKMDMSQKVIDLTPHKDPDEFIKAEGVEKFEQRVKDALTGRLFEINYIVRDYDLNNPEDKTKFMKAAGRLLAGIEDRTERNNYIDTVASKYFLDRDSLKDIVTEAGLAGLAEVGLADTGEPEIIDNRIRRERRSGANPEDDNEKYLLTLLVNNPELFGRLSPVLSEDDFTGEIISDVASTLYAQYREKGAVNPAEVMNHYDEIEDQAKVSEIFTKELDFDTTPSVMEKVLTDIIIKVKLGNIDKKLKEGTNISRIQLAQEKEKIKKIKVKL